MAMKKILKKQSHFDAVQALYDTTLEKATKELVREYRKTFNDVLTRLRGTLLELRESTADGTLLVSDLYRYNRFYQLVEQLNKKCAQLAGEEQVILERELLDMYREIAGLIGRELQVLPLDDSVAIRAINSIWCQPYNWSQRIWKHQEQLVQLLSEGMLNAVVAGDSSKQLAKRIAAIFGSSYKEAERLARTELAHIMNRASLDAYKEAGVTSYKVLTAGNPCPICESYKNQEFPLDELVIPAHPNCRCSTLAVL